MFEKIILDDGTVRVTGLGAYSLRDTLECGQCFRHVDITPDDAPDGYSEYITVVGDRLIRVAQPERGTLIFPEIGDECFERLIRPYFALDRALAEVKADVIGRTDSEFLIRAAELGEGIAILGQDPWEALVSFIISQNNNIPRIKGIIRRISAEYGINLALHNDKKSAGRALCGNSENAGISPDPCQVSEHYFADNTDSKADGEHTDACEPRLVHCPLIGGRTCPDTDCSACGICYTFPTPEDILTRPEGLLPAKCGFRYGYILSAAEAVATGRIDLSSLRHANSFNEVIEELKTIRGVGDKVASCVALFGLGRLEAFPIDVWMKRAIDTYFAGSLDPRTLGDYAGIAQQYIFHYIRNTEVK